MRRTAAPVLLVLAARRADMRHAALSIESALAPPVDGTCRARESASSPGSAAANRGARDRAGLVTVRTHIERDSGAPHRTPPPPTH